MKAQNLLKSGRKTTWNVDQVQQDNLKATNYITARI